MIDAKRIEKEKKIIEDVIEKIKERFCNVKIYSKYAKNGVDLDVIYPFYTLSTSERDVSIRLCINLTIGSDDSKETLYNQLSDKIEMCWLNVLWDKISYIK